MIKIDIALRDIVSSIPNTFIKLLTDKKGVKLLDTSLANVKDKRADLIVELEDKTIFHLELQSFNDKNMPFRMLEYYLLIREKFKTNNISQMVMFVGDKLNMPDSITENNLKFSYNLKDIKELNCKELINSNDLEDKILAVLCNIEDENRFINAIIKELLELDIKKRKDYIQKLLSLSRYRPNINTTLIKNLKERVMPITIELNNDPYYKEGLQQGLQQGLQKGLQKGKEEVLKSTIKILKEFLNEEQIAQKLNISVDKVKEYSKGI